VTSAVKRGAHLINITDVTGHRSLEMLRLSRAWPGKYCNIIHGRIAASASTVGGTVPVLLVREHLPPGAALTDFGSAVPAN
jgi:hypothetical protein